MSVEENEMVLSVADVSVDNIKVWLLLSAVDVVETSVVLSTPDASVEGSGIWVALVLLSPVDVDEISELVSTLDMSVENIKVRLELSTLDVDNGSVGLSVLELSTLVSVVDIEAG